VHQSVNTARRVDDDQLGGGDLVEHAARPRLDLDELAAARDQVGPVGQGGPDAFQGAGVLPPTLICAGCVDTQLVGRFRGSIPAG
jgi:hypothetical protein